MAPRDPDGPVGPSDLHDEDMGPVGRALRTAFATAGRAVAAYTRMDLDVAAGLPPPPALLVANHGFGGLVDLHVFALAETLRRLGVPTDAPLTFLTHRVAWTLGVGPLLETMGSVPAGHDAARAALAAGRYVVVFPGGDVEAAQPWSRRHVVTFAGRSGFARLAEDADVPVVPMVFVGAGESLLVLHSGEGLARWLGTHRGPLRTRALPVSLSLPWGLSVGVVGLVPYLPLPTQIRGAVLPPMRARPHEAAPLFALRVEEAMNDRAALLAKGRIPVLGTPQRAAGEPRVEPERP